MPVFVDCNFGYLRIRTDQIVTVVTRVLNGCSNGAINIGFARLLGPIAATRGAEWLYSRRDTAMMGTVWRVLPRVGYLCLSGR